VDKIVSRFQILERVVGELTPETPIFFVDEVM
jgi:hypothetical protein